MRIATLGTMAYVLGVATGSVEAGGGDGTVELRIVTAETFDAAGHGNGDSAAGSLAIVDLDAASFSQAFYVQARVIGDPTATGLVAIEGRLSDDGPLAFGKAPLLATEAAGVPSPGVDPQGRTGLLPLYRDNASSNSSLQNGAVVASTNEWGFIAYDTAAIGNGAGIGGEWSTVYKFTWSTVDLSERSVVLTIDAESSIYRTDDGSHAVAATPGQFELIFDDCDDIDRDGNDVVNVLDLLDYMNGWFERATF